MSKKAADKILVLTGPTASGKSTLAVHLARELKAEIISADSMQIYRYMDVGTAKIMPEEREGIPHHLIDIKNPDESFSLADWLRLARAKVKEIREGDKAVIVCGGTGLYLDFLIEGLVLQDDSPGQTELNQQDRESLREEILASGLEKAHQRIVELDPEAAERIKSNDEKRIIRFFERLKATGLTLTEHNKRSQEDAESIGTVLAYYLNPERQKLYEKINYRAKLIFDQGLIEEFKMLSLAFPNFKSSQAYQAIAYKEAERLIKAEESYDDAVGRLAQSSRNYAKRQLSWFRRKPYYQEIKPQGAFEAILKDFQSAKID